MEKAKCKLIAVFVCLGHSLIYFSFRRKWGVVEKLGDLAACQKQFRDAKQYYALLLEGSKQEAMYMFKCAEYLRKALFCLVQLRDWDVYGILLNNYQEAMDGMQEYEWMKVRNSALMASSLW
jgi:hypothetical protein